jgi:(p)ppGpp synthase/HD superfamily hydrolase
MQADLSEPFSVALIIVASNDRGLLAKTASQINEAGANIETVTLKTLNGDVHIDVVIEVTDRSHLAQVFKSLRRLSGIKKISRHLSQKAKN